VIAVEFWVLENIGAPAGLPVMEGKSLLYKYLGGVDSFPLVLSTQKEEEHNKCLQMDCAEYRWHKSGRH